MLGKILLFFTIVISLVVGLHVALQNGTVLRFLDRHPHPTVVPAVEYSLAQTFYVFRDLPGAITYFERIIERYPASSYADDATFGRVNCMDDLGTVARAALAEEYDKYLEKFPAGKHAEVVRSRLDALRSGGR